jgi:hypothetical protein
MCLIVILSTIIKIIIFIRKIIIFRNLRPNNLGSGVLTQDPLDLGLIAESKSTQ